MFMMGLNETIDQLAMANSACWHSHMLMKRMVMSFKGHYILKLKVKGRKGGQRGHGGHRLRKKV